METFSALLAICAGNSPSLGNSPHKGQWRGALMLSLICVWINGWVNNREAGDLRCYRVHYDVTVMNRIIFNIILIATYIVCDYPERLKPFRVITHNVIQCNEALIGMRLWQWFQNNCRLFVKTSHTFSTDSSQWDMSPGGHCWGYRYYPSTLSCSQVCHSFGDTRPVYPTLDQRVISILEMCSFG